MTRFRRFHTTTIDGVPCVWMDDDSDTLLGGLVFRVGFADEALGINGISHFVEHLALPAGTVPAADFNGTTDMLTTLFWVHGSPERVAEELTEVSERLSSPPRERIGSERGILRAEAETRSGGDPWRFASTLRYGAVAHGLIGLNELAPYAATDDAIVEWSRTRFTQSNAALYFTGRPPKGLRLRLPGGRRRGLPRPHPIDYVRYPSVHPHGFAGGVAIAMVCRRTSAMMVAVQIAVERLRGQLRFEAATTYHVDWRYEPIGATHAQLLISADCLADEVQATRNRMLGVLEELALTGPTDVELADSYDDFLRHTVDPSNVPSHVYYYAAQTLFGRTPQSLREEAEERRRVTPGTASEALRETLPTMLLLLPSEEPVPAGRFTLYPFEPPDLPTGRAFKPRKSSRLEPGDRVVVGTDGVTARGDGWVQAVPYSRCVAVQRWSDGTRRLWSNDGFSVYIDPADWQSGAAAIYAIDEATDPETWLEMAAPWTARPAGLEAALEASDWEEQIALLQTELERDPESGDAWGYLARAFLATERWAQALAAARRACELDPSDAWAFTLWARALNRLGRVEEAGDVVREAVRIDPGGAHTLSDAAWLLTDVGERELAAEYARRAAELHPDAAAAWFAHAHVLEEAEQLSAAEEAYRRAIELEPGESMWHNNLGWNLIHQERYEDAAAVLEQALELDPGNERAIHNYALVRGLSGDLDTARTLRRHSYEKRRAFLQEEAERDPADVLTGQRLVEVLGYLGRHDEALSVARRLLELDPFELLSLQAAVWSALGAGETDEARDYLSRLVAVPGGDASVHVAVAEFAALLDDSETALLAMEAVREQDGSELQRSLSAGCATAARRKWHSARKRFQSALESEPRNCCAQTWLGLAELAEGDRETALRAYERAEGLSTCECATRLRLRGELETR